MQNSYCSLGQDVCTLTKVLSYFSSAFTTRPLLSYFSSAFTTRLQSLTFKYFPIHYSSTALPFYTTLFSHSESIKKVQYGTGKVVSPAYHPFIITLNLCYRLFTCAVILTTQHIITSQTVCSGLHP